MKKYFGASLSRSEMKNVGRGEKYAVNFLEKKDIIRSHRDPVKGGGKLSRGSR